MQFIFKELHAFPSGLRTYRAVKATEIRSLVTSTADTLAVVHNFQSLSHPFGVFHTLHCVSAPSKNSRKQVFEERRLLVSDTAGLKARVSHTQ